MNADHNVKPTKEEIIKIKEISMQPHHYNLSGEEEVFLWKFRYTFILQKEMLVHFLLST